MKKQYFDIADEVVDTKKIDDFVVNKEYKNKYCKVSKIELLKKLYDKEKGKYISISFDDLQDELTFANVKKELIKMLQELIKKGKKSFLVAGIGNEDFAPDSLGPRVIKKMNATYHINDKKIKNKVACIIPGVMALTGLETASIIKGIVNENKIDMVIVVDSLATSSLKRLNHVIQITDTGIEPGSGIKNYRKGIKEEYLGCKVISIGVGTVISLFSLLNNFGSFNELDEDEENLVLTTKEIEIKIDLITDLIASSINEVLNPI